MQNPRYIKINDQKSLEESVKRAAEALAGGGVILYPTDTLYGLGIDVTNPQAVEKLYSIKGRSNKKPVSLMVASFRQIEESIEIDDLIINIVLQKILPGKITVLLKNKLYRRYAVFEYLQNNPEKIAFRIPDNKFCNMLNEALKVPISTTSANISGSTDILHVSDLPHSITERLDLIIDAGEARDVRGSTIVDFTREPYKIVRKGAVSKEELNGIFEKENIEFVY